MVCKKEQDMVNGSIMFYLREIVTGHQENVVLWVDDHIFSALDPKIAAKSEHNPSMQMHKSLIKFIYDSHYQFNISFILRSGLTTASEYIRSELFKTAIQSGKKFKFVLNSTYQGKPKAGALFLSKFLKNNISVPLSSQNVLMFSENVTETA